MSLQIAASDHQPQEIGPYRIDGRLGHGGMGEVYRGYDRRLERPVALKRVRPDAGTDAGEEEIAIARERLHREARAVAKLSHAAVVQVHDWVETEDGDWIVMELVDGQSLREHLQNGPLEVRRASRIARDIASGLAAAHRVGIIHRDLKPENVMLTQNGDVKILDFGLAKQTPSAKTTPQTTISVEGRIVGTLAYMSPEQALGRPLDHRSDLFSLGTIFFEMLTGKKPFAGEGVQVLTQICTQPPGSVDRLNSKVPAELAGIVKGLLEKSSHRRPQTAEDVVETVEAFLATFHSEPRQVGDIEVTETVFEDATPDLVLHEAKPWWRFSQRTAARILVVLTLASIPGLAWLTGTFPSGTLPSGSKSTEQDPTAGLQQHELYDYGMDLLVHYDKTGNLEKAIDVFQKMLAEDPESAAAYAGLSRAYWRMFYSENRDPMWSLQAVSAGEQAVAIDPFFGDGHVSLGLAYVEVGRLEEAAEHFNQVLALEPDHTQANFGLAKLTLRQGESQKAEDIYRQILVTDPDYWEVYTTLSVLQLRSGRYQEAEVSSLKVVELYPDSILGYRNLATTYHFQGRLGEAATVLQEALKIEQRPSLYNNLGVLYFSQGLYEKSAAAFERALGFPAGANDPMKWGNLGDAYRWINGGQEKADGAYATAIQLLGEALKTSPDDETMQSRLALYRAKKGDCEEAIPRVEKLQRESELNAWGLFRIAVALEVCDQREASLAALENALRAGFSPEEVQSDPELLELRSDPRYHRLITELANQEKS